MTEDRRSEAGPQPDEVADLYGAALEVPDAERDAFLDRACAGRAALRAEVGSLLEAHRAAPEFLGSRPAAALFDTAAAAAGAGLEGRTAGPYRLLHELGRGGMGTVYLAERVDGAFEQRVALKVIRHGLRSEAVHARFLRERQILARLEHPNIARLLDGGVTEDGAPYFAMELVRGTPLVAYCDTHRLAIAARLELFSQACRAVQHAHANLVVHRDLKPSNMLVGDDGDLKLLDFGIAKLLSEGVEEETELTRGGIHPLTPEYAAPEQLRGEAATTATDVYSLGVVLYELLTGRRPFPSAAGAAARDDASRQPEPPSSAVTRPLAVRAADGSQHEVTAAEIAAARSTTPQRLRRELAGDLGAIVLQALQPEAGERYLSVEALAEDLRRFRTGLPVRARPATLRYRVGKLVRRHRVAVAAGVLAFVSLLLGLSASLWQARVAARERDSARRSAARAEQVAGFLSGLFELSEPERARGQTLTAREIIDRGASQIGVELADQPELQADMMMLIGEVYRQLGLYPESLGLFEKALANRRAALGEEDAATAESRRRVGLVLHQSGKYAEARPLLEAARDAFERRDDPIGLASALNDLGNLHRATGDLTGARALLERSVALREEHDPDSIALAKTLNNLGNVLMRLDEMVEARRAYERALALHEKIGGPESILVAQTLDNLSWIVVEAGQPAEAMRLAQRGFAIQQKVLGEHRQVANALNTLGRLAAATGDRALADDYYRRSVEMFEKTLGPDHPDTAYPIRHLGLGYMERKEPEKALPFFERALAIRLKASGAEHMDVAWSLRDVAGARAGMGEIEPALDLYRRSLATWRKVVPADHPQISETLVRMGKLLAENGRCSEGRPLLEEALTLRRAKLAADDPEIAAVEAALRRCAG